MNEKQKQRFWELRGKKSLTSSQREELVLLEEKALKAGLSLEDLEPATSESQLTENELAEIVKSAVEDQVFGLREEILDEVKKAGGKEELEEIVKKYSNQLDSDDLLDKLNEKVEASKTDVEALTEAFKSAVADMKLDSKMVHANSSQSEDAPLIEMPFGNSKESLTVGQKQLHNILLGKDMNQDIPESSLKIAQDRGEARYKAQYKAIGNEAVIANSIVNAEHLGRVNQDLSSQLQESFYGDSALARALISSEINMPTNPFKLPVVTSRPTFSVAKEGTDASSTNIGTANVTLDTAKLIGMSEYTYEIDEDSVLAILPVISSQLSKAAASAFENAVVNGDSAGNAGRDNYGAGDARTAFKGIREVCSRNGGRAEVNNNAAAFTLDTIGDMRAAMGVYGLNPSDLLLIVNPKDYNALILETEVEDASSFGRPGTLQTGVLPRVYGITVIPTAEIPNTYNAGATDMGGGALSIACLVHKPSWFVGVKRGFTVETDQNKINQTNQVIASYRRDFKPLEDPAVGRVHSVVARNIN